MNKPSCFPPHLESYLNESVIHSYCKQYPATQKEAKKLFSETVEFLWSCSQSDRPQSPSDTVDSMWHTFILHTKDYENFCLQKLGKFIHHRPTFNSEGSGCDNGGPAVSSSVLKTAGCTDGGGRCDTDEKCESGTDPEK